MSEMTKPLLKTVKQLATDWSVSEQTIRRLHKSNRLPSIRIGRRVLFDQSEVSKFIEAAKQAR
jgi:excisionase family DNA binding protein